LFSCFLVCFVCSFRYSRQRNPDACREQIQHEVMCTVCLRYV
jgi:hypothetical protein